MNGSSVPSPSPATAPREEAYLLIHGNSGSHQEMEVLIPALPPGVRVMNPDLPQHGTNIIPGFVPRIESCAQWLRENLRLGECRLHIIGFSDGANIALSLMKAGDLDIRSALLLAPNMTLAGLKPWLIFAIKATETVLWPLAWIPALGRVRQRMLMMSRFRFTGPLPSLPTPTHLVFAARDMITRAEQERLEQLLRLKRLVLEGETHMSLPRAAGVAQLLRSESPTARPRLHCLGDSITAGVPGVAYVRSLRDLKPERDGLGGRTVMDLLRRIQQKAPPPGSVCVVEIGTNDHLLPHLRTLSSDWARGIAAMEARGKIMAPDREAFLATYRAILERLHGCRVLCVSIPCIGEDLESLVNARSRDWNLGLKELCTQAGARYLDFRGWQEGEIRAAGLDKPRFIAPSRAGMLGDIVLTRALGLSQSLSRRRRLRTTVDGVHLNRHGAQGLARLIREAVESTLSS